MSFTKIDHIGIAVRDLARSNQLFSALLGQEPYKEEEVSGEMVRVSFFRTGESKIELLQSLKEESAISRFIEKRGEGIHHVAFEVDDIRKTMAELKSKGFRLLFDEPRDGADNKLICFLHPSSTNGVLVEICQEK
jgi:methylmalonyl-CoA/ethylmalonyl-CoA epimerase